MTLERQRTGGSVAPRAPNILEEVLRVLPYWPKKRYLELEDAAADVAHAVPSSVAQCHARPWSTLGSAQLVGGRRVLAAGMRAIKGAHY